MEHERHDTQQGGSLPGPMMIIPIGPIVLAIIVLLILRSRRKSRADRALDRISSVIEDSDLPERAKDILIDTVEEVRSAMATLRARASELTS